MKTTYFKDARNGWEGLTVVALSSNKKLEMTTRKDINNLVSYSGAMAQSPSDGGADDMLSGDLDTAKLFGKRVADVAAKFRA